MPPLYGLSTIGEEAVVTIREITTSAVLAQVPRQDEWGEGISLGAPHYTVNFYYHTKIPSIHGNKRLPQ